MIIINGIPASPGIVIGRVFLYNREEALIEERRLPNEEIENEIQRFLAAIEKTKSEVEEIRSVFAQEIGDEHARIFDAHLLILEDVMAINETINLIRKTHKNAEFVFYQIMRKIMDIMESSPDEYLRERAMDLKDVKLRVLKNLTGGRIIDPSEMQSNDMIIIAKNFLPSDTIRFPRDKVSSFLTDMSGETSHVAILARAMQIPAVVGLEIISEKANNGDIVIVDGYKGNVILNPTQEQLHKYIKKRNKLTKLKTHWDDLRELPAITKDNHYIELAANIEMPYEIEAVLSNGANSIGLFRSEYLYLATDELPDEETQYLAYKEVAEQFAPSNVIIRTFDWGGDKLSDDFTTHKEENPFLGLRGIRFCLQHPEFFKNQLRAILRASYKTNVSVMFPMISDIREILEAKKLLKEAQTELTNKKIPFNPKIPIGIMIEVPSAALISDYLVDEVDFFSIGTNDLIQYTMAVDRSNERLATFYQTYHPAVLRLIKKVIEDAHNANIWVGVCGEMAGHTPTALLLIGMGVDKLSSSPVFIPEIKHSIRSSNMSELKQLAENALKFHTAQEIKNYVEKFVEKLGIDS